MAFQAPVVERQQISFVELDAGEFGDGLIHVGAAQNQKFLGTGDALKAENIAIQMQVDLAPDADRIDGDFDPV